MSHTEGKLSVTGYGDGKAELLEINSDDGLVVARIANVVSRRPLTDEDLANARRLVACWNEHDDLVAGRDELVKVLRDMAERIKRCDYTQARSNALEILARYPEMKS